MIKQFLSSFLLLSLLFGTFPSVAFAYEYESEDESDTENEDEISEEAEDAIDELEEAIFDDEDDDEEDEEDEEQGGDVTIEVETVSETDVNTELVEELEEAAVSGNYTDKLYLTVQWGYFPSDDESKEDLALMESTTWDGDISLESSTDSAKARPFKLLRFERGQDWINLDETSSTNTSFISEIYGHYDGILFKVLADADSDASVVFTTEYSSTVSEVSLSDRSE